MSEWLTDGQTSSLKSCVSKYKVNKNNVSSEWVSDWLMDKQAYRGASHLEISFHVNTPRHCPVNNDKFINLLSKYFQPLFGKIEVLFRCFSVKSRSFLHVLWQYFCLGSGSFQQGSGFEHFYDIEFGVGDLKTLILNNFCILNKISTIRKAAKKDFFSGLATNTLPSSSLVATFFSDFFFALQKNLFFLNLYPSLLVAW